MFEQYFSLKVLGSSVSWTDFGDNAIIGVAGPLPSVLSLSALLLSTRKNELDGELSTRPSGTELAVDVAAVATRLGSGLSSITVGSFDDELSWLV